MSKHVCPFFMGYLLASPIRRLVHKPEKILSPFVTPGMTVLEVGPAMGFFTLFLAQTVGFGGKVLCVDVQEAMLRKLEERLRSAGLADRVITRTCGEDSLGVDDYAGKVDFVLAFAVVHEIPDTSNFFAQVSRVLKAGAVCLVAEPKGHVTQKDFDETLRLAKEHGLEVTGTPPITRCHTAVLRKA